MTAAVRMSITPAGTDRDARRVASALVVIALMAALALILSLPVFHAVAGIDGIDAVDQGISMGRVPVPRLLLAWALVAQAALGVCAARGRASCPWAFQLRPSRPRALGSHSSVVRSRLKPRTGPRTEEDEPESHPSTLQSTTPALLLRIPARRARAATVCAATGGAGERAGPVERGCGPAFV
jgi:hypothetical protein